MFPRMLILLHSSQYFFKAKISSKLLFLSIGHKLWERRGEGGIGRYSSHERMIIIEISFINKTIFCRFLG